MSGEEETFTSNVNNNNTCDLCGWMAAFCSMIAFGSFGAPIKSKVAKSLDIDPLVFQSYKTFMVFCTCWLILLTGEELTFTPWGIVSICIFFMSSLWRILLYSYDSFALYLLYNIVSRGSCFDAFKNPCVNSKLFTSI